MKRLLPVVLVLLLLCACSAPSSDLRSSLQTLAPQEEAFVVTDDEAVPRSAWTEDIAPERALPERDLILLYTGSTRGAADGPIGFAGLAACCASLREDGSEVLLADLGGTLYGSPAAAFDRGRTLCELMQAVGYDAFLPGAGDRLYGTDWLDTLAGETALPFLSLAEGPSRIILDRAGIRLALIAAEDAALSGEALVAAVQQEADAARADGADYVIALSHTDAVLTLAASTHGIDAFLDGSAGEPLECARVRNSRGEYVLISRPAADFASVGMLLLSRSGNLSTGLLYEAGGTDAAILSRVNALYASLDAPVFTAAQTLEAADRDETLTAMAAETNLGDLAADALRAAGSSDIGLVPGRLLVQGLPRGEVSLGTLLSVFDENEPSRTAEITGELLSEMLEFACRSWPDPCPDFLQVSGLTFEIREDVLSSVKVDEAGRFVSMSETMRVQNIRVEGKPLDPNALYTICAPASLFDGGTFAMLADTETAASEYVGDALRLYVSSTYQSDPGAYNAPQNRIVPVNPAKE